MRCTVCGSAVNQICANYGPDLCCPLPCPHCSCRVADPYIEREGVLIILDMVLHRPAVYRHLLFNRPSITSLVVLRIWVVLLVLDVYCNSHKPMACLRTLVQHVAYGLTVCSVARVLFGGGHNNGLLLFALTLSSFAKSLYVLMAIYGYKEEAEYGWLVYIFVFTSNAEALLALTNGKTALAWRYLQCYTAVVIGHCVANQVDRVVWWW